jgi:hypothetical protein
MATVLQSFINFATNALVRHLSLHVMNYAKYFLIGIYRLNLEVMLKADEKC